MQWTDLENYRQLLQQYEQRIADYDRRLKEFRGAGTAAGPEAGGGEAAEREELLKSLEAERTELEEMLEHIKSLRTDLARSRDAALAQ